MLILIPIHSVDILAQGTYRLCRCRSLSRYAKEESQAVTITQARDTARESQAVTITQSPRTRGFEDTAVTITKASDTAVTITQTQSSRTRGFEAHWGRNSRRHRRCLQGWSHSKGCGPKGHWGRNSSRHSSRHRRCHSQSKGYKGCGPKGNSSNRRRSSTKPLEFHRNAGATQSRQQHRAPRV